MSYQVFTFLGHDDTNTASAAATVKTALPDTHVHHYKLLSDASDPRFTIRDTSSDPHNAYNSWDTAGLSNPGWAASWGVSSNQLPALVATRQSNGVSSGYLSIGAQTTVEEIKAFAANPGAN